MDLVQLNKVLRLFNLIINEDLDIIDLNNNTKSKLVNNTYIFNIKDISYKLVISDNNISISNDSFEVFSFSINSFNYHRYDKDNNELEHVILEPKMFSFFSKNDIGNGNSYSILFRVILNGFKFSSGYVEEDVCIKDIQHLEYEINRSKDSTCITTVNRIYNSNHNIKSTTINSYLSPININDYLLNELCNSGYIIGLLSYLKNLLPNFDDYIKSINSSILKIKNDKLSKKISNN